MEDDLSISTSAQLKNDCQNVTMCVKICVTRALNWGRGKEEERNVQLKRMDSA